MNRLAIVEQIKKYLKGEARDEDKFAFCLKILKTIRSCLGKKEFDWLIKNIK